MGEQNPAGTPATIDLAAITKSVTDAVLASIKPALDPVAGLRQALEGLEKNQKILADTLAANKAPDAAALEKLVSEGVVKLLDQRDAATKQTTEQKAKLDAFLADPANGLVKLPAEFKSRLGSDPAKWADEAKGIVGSWEKFVKDNKIAIPDVGGANREGGTPASAGGGAKPSTAFLPEGTAKQVAAIKMPVA